MTVAHPAGGAVPTARAPIGDAGPPPAPAAADARLVRVRRVDGRFVLPDPAAGPVLIWGDAPAGLAAAWAAAGARVLRQADVDAEAAGGGSHAAPAVVVVPVVSAAPRRGERPLRPPAALGDAVARLAVGGWLVVEVAGLWRRPAAPEAWAAVLHGHGLVDAAAFLHWPSFETCSQIVPAGEPGPLRWALERGVAGGWPRPLARLIARPGVAGRLTPCFTVVGRKPGREGA